MRLRSAALIAALWAFYPAVSKADAVLYTFTSDYDTISFPGEPLPAPGTDLDWQFSSASILNSNTLISSFLSSSTAGSFAGCAVSSVLVGSGAVTAPSIDSLTTNFASPCGTVPGAVGEVTGAVADFQQNINSLGTYIAYSHFDGATAVGVLTIADDLTLPGGPSGAPIFLDSPLLGEVNGTIGGVGAQAYYQFNWQGGAFSATASVAGTDGATYLFSEGAPGGCTSGSSETLNSADSFSGTIALANLAPGEYCIGIETTGGGDPNYFINFSTPVISTPEPSSFLLLPAGLGLIALRHRRR
jgi:hypothetical protein